MKTMTCNQLGGACDKEFHAETFDKMAKKSREHAMEMAKNEDQDHLRAMEKMKEKSEQKLNEWMHEKKEEFKQLKSD